MNDHPKLNTYVILVGIAIVLVGLLFYYADHSPDGKSFGWLVIPFTGVGGSVLATGITNQILNVRLFPVALHSVFEALAARTKLIRRNHILTLEFQFHEGLVRLTKTHEFVLFNPGASLTKELSMYTDTVSWRHETRGRFTRIQEPGGNQLIGDALVPPLIDRAKNGKIYFRKTYHFPANEGAAFVFISEEYYRPTDRLIWTVEDFADDFKIYIHNRTGINDSFTIKINHHRESEIMSRKMEHIHQPNHEEIQFGFGTQILPYQGFELMWDLDPTDDERSQKSA
jgi:hypothetical protein